MLESGTLDIMQADIAHYGGISELRRIVAMAGRYGLDIPMGK